MMKVHVLGIDLGKNVCSLVGLDETGAVVLRRRAKRETLSPWRQNFLLALSAWKLAAARIIWAVHYRPRT